MATTYTTNYNLGKQENHADKFDMDVITDNADKIDAALADKADKSTTYTKTEVDTALSGKQATLTTDQLAAVNSGITAEKLAQDENNISTKLSMSQTFGYDVSYALTGTVDLDTLTTVGVYYYTAAAGTTITHAPTTSPFRLEVIQSAGAARYCQFMFANAENALYFRNLVGSSWTGWYKIDATAV